MFVRFRATARRLQASLIETHRRDGKVRHEHVASLGSVPLSLSRADRIAFWTALHPRLAKLDNRLDATAKVATPPFVRRFSESHRFPAHTLQVGDSSRGADQPSPRLLRGLVPQSARANGSSSETRCRSSSEGRTTPVFLRTVSSPVTPSHSPGPTAGLPPAAETQTPRASSCGLRLGVTVSPAAPASLTRRKGLLPWPPKRGRE
jgi:hypothetical protein